jgi:CubicO group peptidase (beta-lactamase class C family)
LVCGLRIELMRAFLALLSLLSCAAAAQSEPTDDLIPRTRELSQAFDAYFQRYAAAHDFSGVALVVQGDKTIFRKTYGYADATDRTPNHTDTAFRIASLSKTFTAAAIAILMERGMVDLKDPLAKYLPDFPNGKNITIEHLLGHASGVGQLDSPETTRNCLPLPEMARRIGAVKPLFAPGTSDAYSNEGYVLLAAVIEKVSGRPYPDFLSESIFQPLGMGHTGVMCSQWPVNDHGHGSIAGRGQSTTPLPYDEAGWNGPGSIYSTAGDLLLWLRSLSRNQLFQFDRLRYPYGWGRRNYSGRKLVEQTGELEGFNSQMSLYFKDKIFFVFLSNVESGMFNRLSKDFEAVAFGVGQPSSPPTANQIPKAADGLSEFAGDYSASAFPAPMHLNVKDCRLWMHWSESPFWRPLIRTGKDDFFMRAEYASIHYDRDKDKKIVSASWLWGDQKPLVMTKK